MPNFHSIRKRTYYKSLKEVDKNRKKGERVYYEEGHGWYIDRIEGRKTFWEKLFGQ